MSSELVLTVGGDEVYCSYLMSLKGIRQLAGNSTAVLVFNARLALDAFVQSFFSRMPASGAEEVQCPAQGRFEQRCQEFNHKPTRS